MPLFPAEPIISLMNYKFESVKSTDTGLEKEIRKLESICNSADGTNYSLFLENAYNTDRTIDYIYLCRHEGELLSLVVLFFPEIKDIEVYGFTHPDHRRRGLFSRLVESTHIHLRALGVYSHLFVCDPSCLSGMAFLQHRGTTLEETEYMMELEQSDFNLYMKERKQEEQSVEIREASIDDLTSISSIASFMYEEERSNSDEFAEQTILSDNREQLVGMYGDKLIGICTIGQEERAIMINGLGIDQSYQGRGLGRDLLNQVIMYSFEKFQCLIKLEVSSVNDKAFNLYKSVGFRQTESYGYYRRISP